MCTAITLPTTGGHFLFGRTMDFSYPLDPELYIVPRGYQWNNLLNTNHLQNKYSFIGIGQDISPITFADGLNEVGFSAAVLYFPGYASYDSIQDQTSSKVPIAAIELLHYLLAFCSSTAQVSSLLNDIRIVGETDSVTQTTAPLHWITADAKGNCMVIEKTADGLHLYDNPLGVLSNSPDLTWHLTNLRNYMNVNPDQTQDTQWDFTKLTPFGQGAGTFGLPGDYTPPSRFVRAAYLKSHIDIPGNRTEAVISCFHIMESVSIPRGSVITSRQTSDYTQYTTFMDLSSKEYFFKTYNNSQITSAKLLPNNHYGSKIISVGKLNSPVRFNHRSLW